MKGCSDRDERPLPIRFGTSGWRGVLGDEFTFERVRAVVAAAGDRIAASHPGARVLVAYDRRFLGERLAGLAQWVLAGRGLRPILVRGAVPTPVLARGVRRSRAAAGLMFTASHNPPEYQGLKLFGAAGAGWDERETRATERGAARWLRTGPPPERRAAARTADLVSAYVDALLAILDRRLLRRSAIRVFYDAMHGAGAGVADEVLRGAGVEVVTLRGSLDPSFGGEAPDPLPERLGALRAAVRAVGSRALGFASDGDADRFTVVDSGGVVLSETESLALLVDHLARTGRAHRAVAVSVATGGLVERVARARGLGVGLHPLGFKHLSAALLAGEADVAGEESGGFALAPFSHDKDGILAVGLMAELAASGTTSLRRRLRQLEAEVGASSSGRTAIEATDAVRVALATLAARSPERVGRHRVRQALTCDGVRLSLDDGFLMLRASGTEPLVRVYAEAPTPQALRRRLQEGIRLLRRATKG